MGPYTLWTPFCLVQTSEFQQVADTLISIGGSLSSVSGMQKFSAKIEEVLFWRGKKKKKRDKTEKTQSKIFNNPH